MDKTPQHYFFFTIVIYYAQVSFWAPMLSNVPRALWQLLPVRYRVIKMNQVDAVALQRSSGETLVIARYVVPPTSCFQYMDDVKDLFGECEDC